MALEASPQSPCAGIPTSTRAPGYARRRPEETVLHAVIREELETFVARAREREYPVPRFVEREFRAYLSCGMLEHGFVALAATPVAMTDSSAVWDGRHGVSEA